MMEQELREAVKAIAMLLDSAVHDYEKDDDCIAAVDFAMSVLRRYPNADTISAMNEALK